jgi:hypothetical protein
MLRKITLVLVAVAAVGMGSVSSIPPASAWWRGGGWGRGWGHRGYGYRGWGSYGRTWCYSHPYGCY